MRGRPLRLNFQRHSIIYILFLFLGVSVATSQKSIQVVDVNNMALEGVLVYDESHSFSLLTDSKGEIELPSTTNYPIHFQFLGYKPETRTEEELASHDGKIILIQDEIVLEELILIGRTDIAQEDLAYESTAISPMDIKLSNAQTSADALSANANVFVQKSQMGGGSPNIRGFEANKLLLVVDGVRLNNAIYRSGHLQNAITVDAAILESMEVIFGPGSLMYGSDAMGGVIHFQSKTLKPKAYKPGFYKPSYYYRYGTANRELSVHGDIEYYGKNWGSFTSLTLSRFDNLRIGRNRANKYEEDYGLQSLYVLPGDEQNEDMEVKNDFPHILRNTAYNQYDALQKFTFTPTDQLEINWNNQFSISSNIPRYDALTEISGDNLRYSQWNYGPQRRFLSSLSLKYVLPNNPFINKIQWINAYQNINESRITSRFQSPLIETQDELLHIATSTLDFSGQKEAHQWFFGWDANFNDLSSRAFQQLYGDETRTEGGLTRYPNDLGRMFSSGIYAQYYLIPNSWYKWNVGMRYDLNQVNVRYEQDNVFQWPDYFYDGVENRNQAFNASTGFHIKLPFHFKLRALAGTSFRAPNIDDIAKIRLNANEISIPNPELRPERSLNGEITFGFQPKNTNISATVFYTYLTDVINRQDFSLPNGDRQYVTFGDTFNIVANVNSDNAIIRGISLNAKHQFSSTFSIDASINFTRGDIIENNMIISPLSHIPPTYGRCFTQYEQKRWLIRGGIRFNARKDISRYGSSVDNPEFATAQGSLSWYTLHLMAAYEIHSSITLQLGLDNILDQFYVPFSSGLPGMGRNFSVMIRGDF